MKLKIFLFSLTALFAFSSVSFADSVTYISADWDTNNNTVVSAEMTPTNPTQVTSGTTTWNGGNFYYVTGSVTIDNSITVSGTANLILGNGAALIASKGINVAVNSVLNIYAQSEGENVGTLTAAGGENAAGIGGVNDNGGGGTVNIYGGTVTANGGSYGGGGIGKGNSGGSGGSVEIYGGIVMATGNSNAPGLREMTAYNDLLILGGTNANNVEERGADDYSFNYVEVLSEADTAIITFNKNSDNAAGTMSRQVTSNSQNISKGL